MDKPDNIIIIIVIIIIIIHNIALTSYHKHTPN